MRSKGFYLFFALILLLPLMAIAAEPTSWFEWRGSSVNTGTAEGELPAEGKLRWSLLPLVAIRAILRVLMSGAEKYGAENWRKGAAWSRYYEALQRHITAWWDGEDHDPEWGHHHLAHAACCVLFLLYFALEHRGTDDRYKESDNADRATN